MISFSYDEYIQDMQDQGIVIWVAELSDGRSVYMDDGRPGAEPYSAWLRLRHFLRSEVTLRVNTIYLRFRSNVVREITPYRADGYFFVKKLMGEWGSEKPIGFYILGHMNGDKIITTEWKVPELLKVEDSSRETDLDCESLIRFS